MNLYTVLRIVLWPVSKVSDFLFGPEDDMIYRSTTQPRTCARCPLNQETDNA